jgi:hypothetical protein
MQTLCRLETARNAHASSAGRARVRAGAAGLALREHDLTPAPIE